MKMNLVKLDLYGEAYYSEAEYSETIYLLEDDYKSLGRDFQGMEVYLGELDGKHSGVYGEVQVNVIYKEKQEKMNFETDNDGDRLYWELWEHSNNIKDMIKKANTYINSIDSMVVASYRVKKSDAKKIDKFVCENISNYNKIN